MARTTPTQSTGFTDEEVIAALTRLEPRLAAQADAEGRPLLTRRQLKYLHSRGVSCLPTDRVSGGPGARGRRLYRVVDVVLLRLALRVASDRFAWHAWTALAYLGDELRSAITAGRRVALVFEGARASIRPVSATVERADAYVLATYADGVEAALRRARGNASKIYNGWRRVPPADLVVTPSLE